MGSSGETRAQKCLRGRDRANKSLGIQTCASSTSFSDQLTSLFQTITTWTLNSPRCTPGDVPLCEGGEFCYSGDGRHKGKAVRDGVSERNNPVEISSPALAPPRECACDAVGGATALKVFVAFVELYSRQYQARVMPSRKFRKCARNYSDPCEIDTV